MPRVVAHGGQHPLLVVAKKSYDRKLCVLLEPNDFLDAVSRIGPSVNVVAEEDERIIGVDLG